MILYAVTAVYFAGVMVRLMLTLTPAVCVLAGIAFSNIFEKYMLDEAEAKKGGEWRETKDTKDGGGLFDRIINIFKYILKPADRRLYDKATAKGGKQAKSPQATITTSFSPSAGQPEAVDHIGMNIRSLHA